MKRPMFIVFVAAVLMFGAAAIADSGAIIEAKGDVAVALPGKAPVKALPGMEVPVESSVATGSDGYAVILFVSGQIRKMEPGTTLKLDKEKPAEGNATVIRGISVALSDMQKMGKGPVVHGMVKADVEKFELTPERIKRLAEDLKKVDELGLTSETGKNILKAQVYYKHRQYQDVLNLLLPIYKSTTPPPEMVKEQIILTYLKMGRAEDAKKYE